MLRSLAVLVFIGGVGSSAVYVGQRRTLAKGEVIAAELLASNPKWLRAIECDAEIEIGVDGAHFGCKVTFLAGAVEQLRFTMNRAGVIGQDGEPPKHTDSADPRGH
jgi:hypothetical protein